MSNVVVPWLGDVMGQSAGLPTSFTQRPYNYPGCLFPYCSFVLQRWWRGGSDEIFRRGRMKTIRTVERSALVCRLEARASVPSGHDNCGVILKLLRRTARAWESRRSWSRCRHPLTFSCSPPPAPAATWSTLLRPTPPITESTAAWLLPIVPRKAGDETVIESRKRNAKRRRSERGGSTTSSGNPCLPTTTRVEVKLCRRNVTLLELMDGGSGLESTCFMFRVRYEVGIGSAQASDHQRVRLRNISQDIFR